MNPVTFEGILDSASSTDEAVFLVTPSGSVTKWAMMRRTNKIANELVLCLYAISSEATSCMGRFRCLLP